MKVYRPQDEDVPVHVLFFSANEGGDLLAGGKQIAVEFRRGVAQVESNIGHYLIGTGLAQRSPLLLPAHATLRKHHDGNLAS